MQTNLLVPFLLTHRFLAFERINTTHIHIQTRQSHTQRRVFGSLSQVHTQTDTPGTIRKTLRIRHTRTSRIFCIGLHIVITIDITTIITRCLKVHTRREIAIRIGFTILRMRPLNTQVFIHIVIRHILFARHIPTIIHRQTTLKFISLDVSTSRIYSPSTTRINITRQLQIKIIIDCKIVTNTRHIQSTRIIISKIRHYETTRVIIRKWKKSKRYRQRQWHISHHQVRRTCRYITTWLNLSLCQLQVEVRMIVIVTSGVFSTCHHQQTIIHFFGSIRYHIALRLFSYRIANKTFLRLQIIVNLTRLITILAFRKNRPTYPLILYRIQNANRIQCTTIHTHTYVLRRQVHTLILQFTRPI